MAHRILGQCLGMTHLRSFTLAPQAAGALFRLDRPVEVMAFGADRRLLEAFIVPEHGGSASPAHACIIVENVAATLDRCRVNGAEVRTATVGEHEVFFVADPDGNLYELKQG
jgi:catechol 2,3-dioxygenase-like lactoylglutathione lyase family enzyme